MRHLLPTIVVCAILTCCLAAGQAYAGDFTVVLPPDRSYVEGEFISVVLNVRPGLSMVQISVNDKAQSVSSKPVNRLTMCYDGIRLSPGMNTIKIAGFEDQKENQTSTVRIFRRSDLAQNANSAPAGFRQYFFHTAKNKRDCQACHLMKIALTRENEQTDERSQCAQCHTKILSTYANVHGPAAVWSCLTCHNQPSPDSKLDVRKPIDTACSECHEFSWKNKKYLHAPTASGACTICHDPHASDREYFLRMDRGELCKSCHEDIVPRTHSFFGFFARNDGHPLSFRTDPQNPRRSLSCVSCHNPHGENSDKFLNGYDESAPIMDRFCHNCHFR